MIRALYLYLMKYEQLWSYWSVCCPCTASLLRLECKKRGYGNKSDFLNCRTGHWRKQANLPTSSVPPSYFRQIEVIFTVFTCERYEISRLFVSFAMYKKIWTGLKYCLIDMTQIYITWWNVNGCDLAQPAYLPCNALIEDVGRSQTFWRCTEENN